MHRTLLLLLAFAVPAMATPPQPMLRIELAWRGPETLVITVENKYDDMRFDATLSVTAGIGPRLVHEEPIVMVPGITERIVRVPLVSVLEEIGVRVTSTDEYGVLLVDRLHVTRDAALSDEEVEQLYAAQRAVGAARTAAETRERMRAHVRRVIARGGKPTCSAEAAAEWNEAVLEELGVDAPEACQRTSNR